MTNAAETVELTGGCSCGAVRFVARNVPQTYGICHCPTCRRWTGSALLEVSVPEAMITWRGQEHIKTRASSEWAERAWCDLCGSPLWFRMTEDSDWSGQYDVPLGLFDDPSGFEVSHEIYIDHKPDSYAYVGDGHPQLTRQDCVAKFPKLASDGSSDV